MYRMRSGQITSDWRRMEQGWTRLFDKMRVLAPEDVSAVEKQASARLYRYLAYIAYENGLFGDARCLATRAFRRAGIGLLRDRRAVLLGAALTAQALLPQGLHARLDGALRRARA
jgi:hypothetical protein